MGAAPRASRSHPGREVIALLHPCYRKSNSTDHGPRRILRGSGQVLPLGHSPEARHLLGACYWLHGTSHGLHRPSNPNLLGRRPPTADSSHIPDPQGSPKGSAGLRRLDARVYSDKRTRSMGGSISSWSRRFPAFQPLPARGQLHGDGVYISESIESRATNDHFSTCTSSNGQPGEAE